MATGSSTKHDKEIQKNVEKRNAVAVTVEVTVYIYGTWQCNVTQYRNVNTEFTDLQNSKKAVYCTGKFVVFGECKLLRLCRGASETFKAERK